jgi:DeoR family transcriptional regulator, carbon catabolite repression regulator
LNQKYLHQSLNCSDIDYMIVDKPLSKIELEDLQKHKISVLY